MQRVSLALLQKTTVTGKDRMSSNRPTSGSSGVASRRSPGRRPTSGTAAVSPLPKQPFRRLS
eukprot:15474416-Alexandrium_andersonii.AAC.1